MTVPAFLAWAELKTRTLSLSLTLASACGLTSSAAASARRAADAVASAPSTGVLFMRFWATSLADSGIWKILLAPSLLDQRSTAQS